MSEPSFVWFYYITLLGLVETESIPSLSSPFWLPTVCSSGVLTCFSLLWFKKFGYLYCYKTFLYACVSLDIHPEVYEPPSCCTINSSIPSYIHLSSSLSMQSLLMINFFIKFWRLETLEPPCVPSICYIPYEFSNSRQ